MADEKTVEQLTSEELFRGATVPPTESTPPAEPPAPETPTEATPPAEPPKVEPPAPVPEAIPSWRLREEAEARRAAEDRARALEARLQEIATHLQQKQGQQPDFFEQPDQAVRTIIQQTIAPIIEEQRRAKMHSDRMIADMVHTPEKVSSAEQAFLKARDDQSLDPMDYERVVQSPNRFDAVVHWHKRRETLSKVGDDPSVWFKNELKNQLADPKFQTEILEAIKGLTTAAKKPTAVEIPPSLSKATAAANSKGGPVGDMSDSSLFAYAMAPKR